MIKRAISLVAIGLAVCLSAQGALYSYSGPFPNSGVIPDHNPIGLTDAHNITGLAPSISSIILTVHFTGNYVDDLTGYLRLGNQPTSPSFDLTSNLSTAATSYTLNLTSTFLNDNPNNTWTLFFADTSAGGVNTLNSWSLDITAVPEPLNMALGIFGVLLAAGSMGSWLRQRSAPPEVGHVPLNMTLLTEPSACLPVYVRMDAPQHQVAQRATV
jgi:hypothetical protein